MCLSHEVLVFFSCFHSCRLKSYHALALGDADCQIAEIIVYASVLTTTQRVVVEQYINAKYQIW